MIGADLPPDLVAMLRRVPGYDPFAGAAAAGCWFDKAEAAKALDFFARMVVHIEGDLAGRPFVLEPWQQAIIANLFGWMRTDDQGRVVRRYREALIYIGRKNGKALDIDTPIPTPGGWVRMGDLRAGDLVFNQDGRPTKVTHAFDVMHDRPCYRVGFSDGTSIVADAEHLWETRPRQKGRGGPGVTGADWRERISRLPVVTTVQLCATLTIDRPSSAGKIEWNHRIDVCGPLELPAAKLPVDPYLLGVWLGDGDSDSARLTCSLDDAELLDHLRAVGAEVTEQRRDKRSRAARYLLRTHDPSRCDRGHPPEWGAGKKCLACAREIDRADRRGVPPSPKVNAGLGHDLRELGVFKNKHIPCEYLRGSVLQRQALLQGLMDTDGYVSAAGQCEFTTTRAEVRDGFLELARTLGYKPQCMTRRASVRGKDCGEKYRIQFWAFADRPCFRLSRKKARLKLAPGRVTRSGTRQIIAVEPVESRPVRCIAVDNPRKLYLAGDGMVPTHNTPLVAGIGLYVFFCDREAGLQGYIAAKDRDQAGLLFRQIEGMVAANPYMAKRCRAYGGNAPGGKAKSLAKPDNSFLKVISADAGGKHGGNSHLVIVDELHEQADRHLIDTLRTSMTSANRKQPLMVYLTTADYDRPSICNERYEFAKKVCADPARDPAFFPVVYEADPGDPWDSEATWAKANPNLGVSVSRAELKRLAAEAADNPALKAEFRRLHTNVRVQKTITSAIDLTLWDGAGAVPLPADLAGRACWAGLDLGWRDDLAALALLFDLGDRRVGAAWRFWVPADGKRDLTAVPFAGFVGGGWLDVTAGNTTDFRAIRDVLDDAAGRYDLRALFLDPSYARSESTELVEAGFPVTEFRQNPASYTAAWKWLIADGLKGGKLAHGNNPVARWQAGHVAVDVNGADGVMPRKRKSTEKIDGICALLMAVAAWLADPDRAGGGSVYESRGLESIYGEEPTAAVHPALAGADQGPAAEVAAPEEPPRWIFGDPDD